MRPARRRGLSRGARDRRLLSTAAFLRAVATGLIGVLLGVHLAQLGLDPARIGAVVGSGLAGGAVGTLLVTVAGDRLGRRRVLIATALLGAAGGLGLSVATGPVPLAVAAFVGMANGMGRDRGAALVVEQAALPATTDDRGRTRAFAWYNLLQDAGHALGALLAGVPAALGHWTAITPSLRGMLVVQALLVGAPAVLYLLLSPAVEAPPGRTAPLSPESRTVVVRLSALFALDAVGGGFLTTALLSYFFFARFGVDAALLGPLFAAARVLNALSHLAAAWLARRIGLVATMVWTHVPSSLLLLTVAIAPTFPVAAALFLLREGLVEMDVPTRQSYVMAVVRPEERTIASGVTHLVRLAGWAVAPFLAGVSMQAGALGLPLLMGAGMKLCYDVALYRAFRHRHAPEERVS